MKTFFGRTQMNEKSFSLKIRNRNWPINFYKAFAFFRLDFQRELHSIIKTILLICMLYWFLLGIHTAGSLRYRLCLPPEKAYKSQAGGRPFYDGFFFFAFFIRFDGDHSTTNRLLKLIKQYVRTCMLGRVRQTGRAGEPYHPDPRAMTGPPCSYSFSYSLEGRRRRRHILPPCHRQTPTWISSGK